MAGTCAPPKLRVALIADSESQPRWIVDAFAAIAASDVAELVAVAAGDAKPEPASWLWRAYARVDQELFGSDASVSEPVSLRARFGHLPFLGVPHRAATGALLAPWRSELQALGLDVAFVAGDVDEAALDGAARYGVWRYCFGPDCHAVEALAGVREAERAAEVTASGLRARLAPDNERLLYQSWSRTFPFSVTRTRENLLRKCVEFPVRALRRLHEAPGRWLEESRPLVPGTRPLTAHPDAAATVRALSHVGAGIMRRTLQKALYVEQWFLAYRFGSDRSVRSDLAGFARLVPPKDRLWADPFPLQRNGRHFVFFEELVFTEDRGYIAMVEIRRDGTCSPPVRVLERDYHLSYPFLIEHGGALYMVPETFHNRTVELYRCIEFPALWRLERVLLRDVPCADATFHFTNRKWWMFVDVAVDGTKPDDELHLFSAGDLLSDWKPHRANPVKSDVRSARPAGRLYTRNGMLYRPAQICVPLYGSGLSLNRVLELSDEAYLEQEEQRILPAYDRGLLGLHTLNRTGDLTVVDGFMRQRRV